jgi:hypothetical protein
MEKGFPKPLIGSLCITFGVAAFIGLCLFFIFFFVLKWARDNSDGCGIDVFQWL